MTRWSGLVLMILVFTAVFGFSDIRALPWDTAWVVLLFFTAMGAYALVSLWKEANAKSP